MTSVQDPLLREELEELVDTMCKALNEAKRLAILHALRTGPHTVTELCQAIQAPQSNTSRHLAILRDRGLIKADRHGSNVVYSLRHPKIVDAIGLLRQVMTDEHSRQQVPRSAAASPGAGPQPSRG